MLTPLLTSQLLRFIPLRLAIRGFFTSNEKVENICWPIIISNHLTHFAYDQTCNMKSIAHLILLFGLALAITCDDQILYKPDSPEWKSCIEDEQRQFRNCRSLLWNCENPGKKNLVKHINSCAFCAEYCIEIGFNVSSHGNVSRKAISNAAKCSDLREIAQLEFCAAWEDACKREKDNCWLCALKCIAEAKFLSTYKNRFKRVLQAATRCMNQM